MNNDPVAIVKLGGDIEWLTDVLPYNAKLYTHPAKTLTDEEIAHAKNEAWKWKTIFRGDDAVGQTKYVDDRLFAEAILRKAQE